MQFPPGGAYWALLSGTASLLQQPTGTVAKLVDEVSEIFSTGAAPVSVKSALNPCDATSDCPSARIRAASWSRAFQAEGWGDRQQSDTDTPAGGGSEYTAFIYGGLGMQEQLPVARRGDDPQLDTVVPLHDLWRFTAVFARGDLPSYWNASFLPVVSGSWKRIVSPATACSDQAGATGCADAQQRWPPAVGAVAWATPRRLFLLSTGGEEGLPPWWLPTQSTTGGAKKDAADSGGGGGGTELWAFTLDNGHWERRDAMDPPADAANGHQQWGLWPGARDSVLASADGSGWMLGGGGPSECTTAATSGRGERGNATENGSFSFSSSSWQALAGLWRWSEATIAAEH